MDSGALLHDFLTSTLAQCRAVLSSHGGVIGSLFMAGLLGGVTHCVGMCGPFVLAQTVARLESVPSAQMSEFGRLSGAALLPYQLGRATTYTALGAIGGAVAQGAMKATDFRSLAATLLLIAAVAFALYGLRRLGIGLPSLGAASPGKGRLIEMLSHTVRPLMADPRGWRGYAVGVALGFLPCGLLYGALAAASSSGSALAGALGMFAFVVGTVPALMTVALAGHVAGRHWRSAVSRLAPLLLMANAGMLTYLAWRVMG